MNVYSSHIGNFLHKAENLNIDLSLSTKAAALTFNIQKITKGGRVMPKPTSNVQEGKT